MADEKAKVTDDKTAEVTKNKTGATPPPAPTLKPNELSEGDKAEVKETQDVLLGAAKAAAEKGTVVQNFKNGRPSNRTYIEVLEPINKYYTKGQIISPHIVLGADLLKKYPKKLKELTYEQYREAIHPVIDEE